MGFTPLKEKILSTEEKTTSTENQVDTGTHSGQFRLQEMRFRFRVRKDKQLRTVSIL